MPIKVQCACGKSLSAKDELAGKTVKCPGCQQPLKIPGGAASAAKVPAKPAAGKPAATPKSSSAKPAANPAPAPSRGASKSAATAANDLYDELGLQAAAPDTH